MFIKHLKIDFSNFEYSPVQIYHAFGKYKNFSEFHRFELGCHDNDCVWRRMKGYLHFDDRYLYFRLSKFRSKRHMHIPYGFNPISTCNKNFFEFLENIFKMIMYFDSFSYPDEYDNSYYKFKLRDYDSLDTLDIRKDMLLVESVSDNYYHTDNNNPIYHDNGFYYYVDFVKKEEVIIKYFQTFEISTKKNDDDSQTHNYTYFLKLYINNTSIYILSTKKHSKTFQKDEESHTYGKECSLLTYKTKEDIEALVFAKLNYTDDYIDKDKTCFCKKALKIKGE
ncbi:MAG: hypothetical protein DRG78_03810 [Epsilonproteobacteria bacterium]|nr:MAG: hypothetical protein DRG78_03810 [Campylobacterota bacterium]